jgi:hypothetical protein
VRVARRAVAAVGVWPGFRRNITRSHQADRASRNPGCRTSAAAAIGTATSKVRPTSAPKNDGGATPTIVNGTRSTVRRRPIAAGDPPKRRCQKS